MPSLPARLTRIRARARASFGAKLLAALLLCVGAVLASALLVVRFETSRQVRIVTERLTQRSREAFHELEQFQQSELARLGSAFTESPRTLAALEELQRLTRGQPRASLDSTAPAAAAAPESNERVWLIDQVRYELELKGIARSLAVFTDAAGHALLTLTDGEVVEGETTADIRRLAVNLLRGGGDRLDAYAVLGDQLFAVQVERLDFGASAIGTIVLGLPLDDELARSLADVLDVELCFVVAGRCMAGTPRARGELASVLTRVRAEPSARLVSSREHRWAIMAAPLAGSAGFRAVALSMDTVLGPFERIQRALLVAGALSLALAIVLATVLSLGLVRPVRELEAATGRVAAGHFATRVAVRSTDEIGRLAAAFNVMTEGLELKERYRGVLDKVVSHDVAEELLKSDVLFGGETRDVTVLFADISSFTSLTEGMEPQRVIALLNDCMARLGNVVETSGGVVDKYLGDGLMALFGAPVQRPDDTVRAVRAALAMQERTLELSRERVARGDPPIGITIGIDSGPVFAGNMGSPNRLNYTVVGGPANLAARLCKAAGPGEILVSDAVQRGVLGTVRLRGLGARAFKGFSRPVEIHAVVADHQPGEDESTSGAGDRPRGAVAVLLTMVLTALSPPPVHAQGGGLPTLAELGLAYQSPSGRFQLDLSGRLDLEGYFPQDEPQWLVESTDPFLAGRLRLFADVFVGERLYGSIELRADRGEAPADAPLEARLEQMFVRLALPLPGRLALQLGKFTLPVGGYPERHHTAADPLIRPPVMYDHRSIIAPRATPAAAAGFLGWKDEAIRRPGGAPIIWSVPYPWGAMLAGGVGSLDLRVAWLTAAPSSAPETWELDADRIERGSFAAAASYPLTAELRLNAYFARGPFLEPLDQGTLPAGSALDDFVQQLWGAEAIFARGPVVLRSEFGTNRWDVPNIADPVRDISYSIEGALKLTAGLFAAARFGEIRFNELEVDVTTEPWDHDIRRFQLGAGYRLLRNTELRAEYLLSRTSGDDPRDDLLSFQWWWSF